MPYAFMQGFCINCRMQISFNHVHVPSVRVGGKREPLCRGCHEEWNQMHRVSKGLEPVELHPDAYSPEEVNI